MADKKTDKPVTAEPKKKKAPKEEAPAAAPPVAAPKPSTPPRPKVPKLVKKDKHRLPRKEKKALLKARAKGPK